jgi:hypothetical protein
MCEQDYETEDAEREQKDAYDEFEDRVGRVGIFIIGIWGELTTSERIGHLVALGTFIALIVYTGYTMKIYKAANKSAQEATRATDVNLKIIKSTFAAYITVDFNVQGGYEPVTKTQRAFAQVWFSNHGRTKTYVSSQYVITEMRLPEKREVRTVASYSGNELIARDTDPRPVPHHHSLKAITLQEMDRFHDRFLAFELSGQFSYDDGFGEIINTPICEISTAYQTFSCDQLDYYLPYTTKP